MTILASQNSLLKFIPREFVDPLVYKFPTNSRESIANCIEPMKIFWNASPPNQAVFGTIDVKKFAKWVGTNKIPLVQISLSERDFKILLPCLEDVEIDSLACKEMAYLGCNLNYRGKHSWLPLLATLGTCKNIQHLKLDLPELRNDDLDALEDLTSLRSLYLTALFHKTTAEGFLRLTALTNLTALTLMRCELFETSNFVHLAGLTKLNSLDLSFCQLTDGFDYLPIILPQLTALNLTFAKMTEGNFKHWPAFTQLTFLNLSACEMLDEDLEYLSYLEKLEFLDLGFCRQLTDEGIATLKNLRSSLKILDLSGCTQVTKEGLKALGLELKGLDSDSQQRLLNHKRML